MGYGGLRRGMFAQPTDRHQTKVCICLATGIDFAGVHDSFWTHAGTVERMNELLREKFVDLHSQVRVDGGAAARGPATLGRLHLVSAS